MARGSAQQEALLNAQGTTSFNNAQNLLNQASSGYAAEAKNPGYLPSEQSSLYASELQPVSSGVASGKSNLYNTAARTRNSGGVAAAADSLARAGMSQMATGSNKVATDIANARIAGTQDAMKGLTSLYAPTLSSASTLYGQGTDAMLGRTGQKVALGPLGTFGFS